MIDPNDPRHRELYAEACHRFADLIDRLAVVLGQFDAVNVAMVAALHKSTLTAPELVAYLRQLADFIERTGEPPTLN